MVEDGEISRVKRAKRAKYNFTIKNFLHLHRCNWLLDDLVFVHGRVKAQMTFLYQTGYSLELMCRGTKTFYPKASNIE